MYSGEMSLDDCSVHTLLAEICFCYLSEIVGPLKVIKIQCYFQWTKLELNTGYKINPQSLGITACLAHTSHQKNVTSAVCKFCRI